MKFLVLAFCLVSVASGYKQFITVGGRNVIGDNGGRGGSGSGGSGLSGASAFGGAGSGSSGASWSSGSSSSSWGGAGGRGGSKGLGGSGSLAALASPVNKYKASGLQGSVNLVAQPVTQVVNAAPSIPLISGGGYGGGYGGGQQISSGGGGLGLIGSGGWGGQAALASAAPSGGVITAAVITRYNVQYVDVPSQGGQPVVQQIVIPAKSQPLEISFESQSSPITVRQTHIPGQAAAPQVSSHQEEPDILKQEIVKPVIHEVIEAIQPFRKITQEVRPVIETVNQIISRGQQQQQAVASVGVVGSIAKPTVASGLGLVGSIGQPSASAVASNFLQKPVQFAPQSLDISIAKPQLAIPQISQVQPVDQAALAGNQLQQIQQITQQLIDKAKKAAAAKRAA